MKYSEYTLTLSEEEFELCRDLIVKKRMEEKKKAAYQEAFERFEYSVQALIDVVGIENAKRIIRDYNRKLREL